MRIQTRGAGPHADIDINGSVITVAGELIDCAAAQGASEIIIDVRRDSNGHVRLGGAGYQLASVAIPPRQYEAVATGNVDDSGDPIYEQQPIPLDPDAVLVTLWTV